MMISSTTAYEEQVRYLESLLNIDRQKSYTSNPSHPSMYLKRISYFLELIGSPQNRIKNYIHIGGTSGKGSVSNFIHNIICASGKKCGLYTSPYVTETIEKFRINDLLISPEEFCKITDELKPHIDYSLLNCRFGVPSYFEICFALASKYFADNGCEYFVSEVGLGGEFDATNAVKDAKITAITHIDYDHTELLGSALTKIASTKSKIIKQKSEFLTAERRSVILKIFKDECKKCGANFNKVKPDLASGITFDGSFTHFKYEGEEYKIRPAGKRQVENAVLAIEIAKKLGINPVAIKEGLERTFLPARFEIIPGKPAVVLDVAHNPDKISSTMANLKLLKYKKLHVVYASAADKDLKKIAGLVAPFADSAVFTRFLIKDRKCADPSIVEKYWLAENKNLKTNITLDPHQALKIAAENAAADDLVLITGSFFLVGELRKKWCPADKILRTRKIEIPPL